MITDVRASQMFLLLHEAESVARIARRLKMSEKTVRKHRDVDQLSNQIERAERSYRTRDDPLAEFWGEIVAFLQQDSRLKPYAILDWLKQKYNPPEPPRLLSWKRQLSHGTSGQIGRYVSLGLSEHRSTCGLEGMDRA